jgi:hypothetical protein
LSDSSSSSVEENRLAPDFLEEAEFLLPFSGSPLLPGVPEQEENRYYTVSIFLMKKKKGNNRVLVA